MSTFFLKLILFSEISLNLQLIFMDRFIMIIINLFVFRFLLSAAEFPLPDPAEDQHIPPCVQVPLLRQTHSNAKLGVIS